MTEPELKKFTQRLPAHLHEFARNEAYRKKMSLNDYIIGLIQKEKDGNNDDVAFSFEMSENDFAKALAGSEDEFDKLKKFIKANKLKLDTEGMVKFAANRVASIITKELVEKMSEQLEAEVKIEVGVRPSKKAKK